MRLGRLPMARPRRRWSKPSSSRLPGPIEMSAAQSWSLRVATPADADTVSALLDRSYPTLWASHYEPALIEAVHPFVVRANPKLLASGTYFVAIVEDGLAVGCG